MNAAPLLSSPGRTATVIVLVVFLQLIVLSVLGLDGISRDRREATRESRERANAVAVADAEGMLEAARTERQAVLAEALQLTSPEGLKALTSRAEGRMVDLVYRVEESGVIRWLTGKEALWLPTSQMMAMESLDIERRGDVEIRRERVAAAQRAGDHVEAVRLLEALVRLYPLRKSEPESVPPNFPDGLAWTVAMLQHAGEAMGQSKALPWPLRTIMLLALETDAIHRSARTLPDKDATRYLELIQQEVEALTQCEVDGREDLLDMVSEFRRARTALDGLRPALETVARRYREEERRHREAGAEGGIGALVLSAQGEVFAVQKLATMDDVLVLVRLDLEEARQHTLAHVGHEALARQGGRLEVLRTGVEVAGRPLWQQDIAREGELELPLRAVLYRDETLPDQPGTGRSEGFYLGIIALAALGLLVGAVVLVRMWRREVRLARLKADFVSNLSHELKTPLTSISLFTEMLQEGKLASEEERAEGLAILAQESQRLQRIVARMIDVARREARGTPYDLVLGDLTHPVREAALRFRRIVTEPGLDLVVHIPPDPLPVHMDAAAVDDAVTNLLSNAWKYKRGDRSRIELSVRRRGRKAVIDVVDDGIGIPRNERKRVFEMFYRAENYLTREVAGTGLGLALVRSIVRAHRGRIHVEAGHGGVGTSFQVTLPLSRQPLPAPGTTATPAPASQPTKAPSAP